ncbi:dihydropteroate synthase [Methanocorpusculum sp. MG]|uniref:Dihydropteroate synthase n=1 Tax=Methanocorpusculum petauri TaxID=3002863 RepID=A0ABT4IJG2_9EURY|nr:dihydropteroate synthase [Methanocorpusculum petauri]MCZ0861387.1 dihydropteroate synthase [Methanocorpusculum petauri]MDE2444159.1 dihydropteroate synthase [Methanocorpusculum sp.]
MHILFPTGRQSETALRSALAGIDAFTYSIVPTGEIASFLSPGNLSRLLLADHYDLVVVSGMCTASFAEVEQSFGIPVRKGTRHAADMRLCIPLILSGGLSATIPADDLLSDVRRRQAADRLSEIEHTAEPAFVLRGVKFGGTSRIKIIHEIMDAHRHPALRDAVLTAAACGADVVDLGFGFDATPDDVRRCFTEVADLDILLSVDTIDPALIKAALFRCDLIFSLTSATLPLLAAKIEAAGAAVVLIPRDASLADTVAAAKKFGLSKILADPLLQPPLSGMIESLSGYLPEFGCPKVLGCVNVVEMVDADSPGMCALLAAAAEECGVAAVLVSEHSDKTRGATQEMRRAVEMTALSRGRPYPKDVGRDVLILKEKRRRREPPLVYETLSSAPAASADLAAYDPCGNFRIGVENGRIVAVRGGRAISGTNWHDVFSAILAENGVSLLDHAAYLGKELYKAELAIRFGRSFEQDGEF